MRGFLLGWAGASAMLIGFWVAYQMGVKGFDRSDIALVTAFMLVAYVLAIAAAYSFQRS